MRIATGMEVLALRGKPGRMRPEGHLVGCHGVVIGEYADKAGEYYDVAFPLGDTTVVDQIEAHCLEVA